MPSPTTRILSAIFFASSCAFADEVPSFRNDVMPVLSKSGCNLGTCHGNQNGKGGLKLSLRGQSPNRDFATIARSLAGRRVNVLEPDASLLLQKPLAEVPHMGGKRSKLGPSNTRYCVIGSQRDCLLMAAMLGDSST